MVGIVVGGALVVDVVVAAVTVVDGRLFTAIGTSLRSGKFLAQRSVEQLTLAKWHLSLPVASRVACDDRVAEHVEAGQAGIESFGAESSVVLGKCQETMFQGWRRWAENGFASGRGSVPSLIHIACQVRPADDNEPLLTAVLHSAQIGASAIHQSSESVRN